MLFATKKMAIETAWARPGRAHIQLALVTTHFEWRERRKWLRGPAAHFLRPETAVELLAAPARRATTSAAPEVGWQAENRPPRRLEPLQVLQGAGLRGRLRRLLSSHAVVGRRPTIGVACGHRRRGLGPAAGEEEVERLAVEDLQGREGAGGAVDLDIEERVLVGRVGRAGGLDLLQVGELGLQRL